MQCNYLMHKLLCIQSFFRSKAAAGKVFNIYFGKVYEVIEVAFNAIDFSRTPTSQGYERFELYFYKSMFKRFFFAKFS